MNRGQAYTLEGVIGAIIVVSALVLGLQAVSIAPFTGGTADEGTELRVQTEDAMDIAQDEEALAMVGTCLGGSDETTPHPGVVSTDPAVTRFGELFANTLDGVANYNVYVDYPDSTGAINKTVIGPPETPVRASVTVTRQVVLFDSDTVYELDEDREECLPTAQSLGQIDDDDIYLTDQNPDSEIYAVVQIRVVAW